MSLVGFWSELIQIAKISWVNPTSDKSFFSKFLDTFWKDDKNKVVQKFIVLGNLGSRIEGSLYIKRKEDILSLWDGVRTHIIVPIGYKIGNTCGTPKGGGTTWDNQHTWQQIGWQL